MSQIANDNIYNNGKQSDMAGQLDMANVASIPPIDFTWNLYGNLPRNLSSSYV